MKLRIFLLVFFAVAVSYFAADYLFVSSAKQNTETVAKGLVTKAANLYRFIYRSDSMYGIRAAEELAKKQELLDAFDHRSWERAIAESETDVASVQGENAAIVREIMSRVQIELNVITNMKYDRNDALFVVDSFGNVVAKNLDGLFGHQNLSGHTLFSSAVRGISDIDVVTIAGRTYKVVATPMYIDGEIAGAYCSGDLLNNESANNIANALNERQEPIMEGGRIQFAFFNKNRLIGSSLPPETHEGFRRYIEGNKSTLENILQGGSRINEFDIDLAGEKFFVNISKHPGLSEDGEMFYATMISADKVMAPLKVAHRTLGVIAIVLMVLGLILSIVIDEYFNKPVNKFMENMLEIINGNLKHRFDNDAEGVEGALNQNANMMIASLLGERIPDKDTGDK